MRSLLFLFAGTALTLHAVEAPLPAPLDPTRYDSMLEQSPFALATVTAAPAAPTKSFAENWNLTGLAKLPDAEGNSHDFITVRSRDARVAFSLFGDEPSHESESDGVSLASVEWNLNDPRKSTATLKKGTEFAKVEFGQETTAPPAGVQMPRPNTSPGMKAPGQPQPWQGVANPAITAPRPPGQPPAVNRPVLPRPGNVGVQQLPGMKPQITGTNSTVPPSNTGRKIRVINSHP